MLTTDQSIPTSYVVRSLTTCCSTCGHIGSSTEVYAKFLIRPRNGAGQPVKDMKRVDRAEYNLPVERTTAPMTVVPFCFDCPSITLDHLPKPPSAQRLYDLAEPAPRGAGTRATAKPSYHPPKPRLEDLA